ncbi:MAG: hypothetical protein Q9210_007366 [Variospora velana]
MHFSTTLLLSSVFSFSLALPADFDPKDLGQLPQPGRLNVSYSGITYSQLSGSLGEYEKPDPTSKPFTIKAYNSEHPKTVHEMDITASNGKFWVGNATGSYCPRAVTDCPVGNVTALQITKEDGADLVVTLREGQSIRVNERAELVFANKSVPMPDFPRRPKEPKFALSPNPIPPLPGVSAFIYSGVGKASGYLACPIAPEGPWQVFAEVRWILDSYVPGGDKSQCIGIDALATNYTSPTPAAYQYA